MSTTMTRVSRHYQITVPRPIRESVGLKEGDLINFEIRNGEIIMSPICLVKKSQAYFWSDKCQKAIKESEDEIKRGHYKVYRSSKELEKDMDIEECSEK